MQHAFPFLETHIAVKFSIPRHSIFGILLRSPWWVSIMLAIALSALLAAFIPREYVFFAIVSTFPLLLVGLVAGWRQLHMPSQERRAAVLTQANQMNWDTFSKNSLESWRILGIHATASEHAGADWRIAQEGKYTLVYARRWKAAVHGLEPLRQLAEAMEATGIHHGLYFAVEGELSPPAQRYAREHNIQVWSGDSLSLFLLGKLPPNAE
ncbi:restriction endonuclease [Lampropedia puyangensis]|uniref:Restriction endonuclease n=1 Tax=Lampropedia puyangensis TaxID=1330072 RepID=A0A4S8FC51_9BURK|nr:restriction endonuclease [Lampropedia puyangensis]THU04114.1 restriction endonuclease [Lampropedia puyangensis]